MTLRVSSDCHNNKIIMTLEGSEASQNKKIATVLRVSGDCHELLNNLDTNTSSRISQQ